MITRSYTSYYKYKDDFIKYRKSKGKKKSEATANLSISFTSDELFEEKIVKLLDEFAERFDEEFQKTVKKQEKKFLEKLEDE